jgi:hypothetical protein
MTRPNATIHVTIIELVTGSPKRRATSTAAGVGPLSIAWGRAAGSLSVVVRLSLPSVWTGAVWPACGWSRDADAAPTPTSAKIAPQMNQLAFALNTLNFVSFPLRLRSIHFAKAFPTCDAPSHGEKKSCIGSDVVLEIGKRPWHDNTPTNRSELGAA